MLSLVLVILNSWANGPDLRTEARPPNPVIALGKLLPGRILLASIKEGMTQDQVERRLRDSRLWNRDAFGCDACSGDYGVLVFSNCGPNGHRRENGRKKGPALCR